MLDADWPISASMNTFCVAPSATTPKHTHPSLASPSFSLSTSGMAHSNDLEAQIGGVDAKIEKLESKQDRVEAALEGSGSYLGRNDHVCAVSAETGLCRSYQFPRLSLCPPSARTLSVTMHDPRTHRYVELGSLSAR